MMRRMPLPKLATSFRLPLVTRRPPPAGIETEPEIGPVLVLSGGARMGAVQVGILRALSATGFRPAAVIGTSAGAFNAACVAFHPEDERHELLRSIWEELRFQRIFNRSPLRMFYNAVVRRDHFYSNAELRNLLQEHVRPDEIRAAATPLYIVATNLSSGEKTVFHSGSVRQSVLASAAIPGFFAPVSIDGQLYVDGAVTANLDFDTAIALGARHIVAVDVSASVVPGHARTIGAVIGRSIEIVLRERTFSTLERLEPRARVTLLRPGPLTMGRLAGIASMKDLLNEADRIGEELVARAFDAQGRMTPGLFSTEPLAPMPALAPIS